MNQTIICRLQLWINYQWSSPNQNQGYLIFLYLIFDLANVYGQILKAFEQIIQQYKLWNILKSLGTYWIYPYNWTRSK